MGYRGLGTDRVGAKVAQVQIEQEQQELRYTYSRKYRSSDTDRV